MSTLIHLISTLGILLFILMYVLRETLFTKAPGYNKSFNFKAVFWDADDMYKTQMSLSRLIEQQRINFQLRLNF